MTLPKPVKSESRICFGIKYFQSEADAAAFAADVVRQDMRYNGGFFHGLPCGRDKTLDHTDPKLGPLYAVTVE